MKVSSLIKILQSNYVQDEEIIVLWWDRFLVRNNDETSLTKEAWSKICTEFDQWENAGRDINEWVAEAILEYSVDVEQ